MREYCLPPAVSPLLARAALLKSERDLGKMIVGIGLKYDLSDEEAVALAYAKLLAREEGYPLAWVLEKLGETCGVNVSKLVKLVEGSKKEPAEISPLLSLDAVCAAKCFGSG